MDAFNLSDNYYDRKCYLQNNEVPTQSVMKDKMSPPLANVYFKSMTYKLKVLAGLEPLLKGGGSEWYQPPEELLKGRAVMKPTKKQYLSKLGYLGIDAFGIKLVENHQKLMEEEKEKALKESDEKWKAYIEAACENRWNAIAKESAQSNTEQIKRALHEFTSLYTSSINKIQNVLFNAAIKDIKLIREETCRKMSRHYESLLKNQATMLYDRYTKRLNNEKERLKCEFIERLEKNRYDMSCKLHDINVEKHTAIEKLRHLLECQNLACQVYVALKEREECEKEIKLSKHEHEKEVEKLKREIAVRDFEIHLEQQKAKRRANFKKIWIKKVCHVVKKFQMFVSFCLNKFPDHAEFFINMEKLMLLQLNEAVEEPSVESFFESEEPFHTPVPRPHPFYLFCDKGFKTDIDPKLCPKRCTSSASQLSVIILNKRCIYAACDNFEMFTDKIKEYIHGERGNDVDVEDDHDYAYDVPIKYTQSKQLLELKLQSSLMQVLQDEIPNANQVPVECCVCQIPFCFCCPYEVSETSMQKATPKKETTPEPIQSGHKINTRSVELIHYREPKIASYMAHVRPTCVCPKTAKKHLKEHLPPYMRNVSAFETVDLPNYEPCSVAALKNLIKKAKGIKTPPPQTPLIPPKSKNVCTDYSDQEFDFLCTCFSSDELETLHNNICGCKDHKETGTCAYDHFEMVGGKISPTYLNQRTCSFATKRAYSLRKIINDSPELEQLFMKTDCNFD